MRTHYCQNCGSPVRGEYCHVCGQKDDDYRRPILALTNEFFGDVFQWDSRILRSFIPFLFMPGTLTRSYVRGRRQQFVSPLRFYFVLTFVFFLALGFSGRAIVGLEKRNILDDFPNLAGELEGIDQDDLFYDRDPHLAFFVNPDHMAPLPTIPIEDISWEIGDFPMPPGLIAILEGYNLAAADSRVLNGVIKNAAPILMVILVPFFSLLLGALFVRRRAYLIDHLVFALHYHSFMFALLLIGLVIAAVTDVSVTSSGLGGVMVLLLTVYLYVAMLRVYRGGFIKTAFKLVILAVVYANVFLTGLVAFTLMGLAQL